MEKAEHLVNDINTREGLIVLDWPSMQKACLNKKDLIIKLLGLFIQQTPGWLQELKESVGECEIERIRMICHTVIGASSAIHATACADQVKKLNATAKENEVDPAQLQKALDEVVLTLEKTNAAIADLINTCSAS